MNSAVAMPISEQSQLVSVFLTCVSCGKTEEIRVRRERKLPGKIYWECLSCQKNVRGLERRSIA
jgi:hypothetical protein